jgi:hypothetical protein
MQFFVSRQHYYYQDIKVVEIAYPSIDYSGSDMLTTEYAGEGSTFDDPREALQTAINIRDMWSKDSEEDIGLTFGHFDMCEGEPQEIEELKKEVNKFYEDLPKCDYCGEIINEKEYYTNDDVRDDTDIKFCSEYCSEKAYFEAYDLCYVCEKEFKREDMTQKDTYMFICDDCQNLEDDIADIDLIKINDDLYVGNYLSDQQITRYLLGKTYLNDKDLSNLKDKLEKIAIDIYILDEEGFIVDKYIIG